MAIGRLVHLGSQVTLSTNSSASVNVPNDGSVVAGDLLIAACVMPSGSRTFSISGGGGAWTSLGTASQSGHMSQVWWRLATAGDLGATITITPSTGAIRQVMLLGKVSGVDQSTPVAATSNTSASSTTKTTPSASPSSTVREVGIVWDTRGASTPQTSSWTAPSGHTRQGQAFTTSGSGACSGAWGDSDTTLSGTIGSRVWTADVAALGSAWTLSVKPGPTVVSLPTVTEIDTAQASAGRVAAALPIVSAVEAAQLSSGVKSSALTRVEVIETTQAHTGIKARSLGTAVELDSSVAPSRIKQYTLGRAETIEAAQMLAGGKQGLLSVAGVAEAVQALAGRVTRALGTAQEVDEVVALTTPGRLSPAVESDQAQPMTGLKIAALPTVTTVETALALAGWKTATPAPAGALEGACILTGHKVRGLVGATETDTAQALAAAVDVPDDISVSVGPAYGYWEAGMPW